MREKILFRSDGNAKMGLGHVFRSLSLIEMLREEYDCTLLIRQPTEQLRLQIDKFFKQVIVLAEEEDWKKEITRICQQHLTGREVIILDGYHFDTTYQKAIAAKGNPVISIDDIPNKRFCSDAILNHGANILPQDYNAAAGTIYYLGLDYSILRNAFREVVKKKRQLPLQNDVFICFGGGDHQNYTLRAIEKSIELLQPNQINVVTGAAYAHQKSLAAYIEQSSVDIRWHSNLSAEEMVAVITQSKIAICPPSTIS